jgi:hypothetical protein
MFIVFAMCVLLLLSAKLLLVQVDRKVNTIITGSERCKWIKTNNKLHDRLIFSIAVDSVNTQTIYGGTNVGIKALGEIINGDGTVTHLWIDNPYTKIDRITKRVNKNNHNAKPVIVNSRNKNHRLLPVRKFN